jgi:hypothetical protein
MKYFVKCLNNRLIYILKEVIITCFKFIYNFIMKNLIYFIIILVILFIYLLCSPLRYYYSEFGEYPISYEHESWGQFGDFIGGIYNPIIGLLTLMFTMYIAYIANKITKQQSRPYCNIIFNDYENEVGIDIENAGNGPLIIKTLLIYERFDLEKKNIEIMDLLPELPKDESWSNYVEEVEERAVSAGNRLNLFLLKLNESSSEERKKLRDKLRNKIHSKVIEVTFTDIHNEKFSTSSRNMEFFNRHKRKEERNEKKGKVN